MIFASKASVPSEYEEIVKYYQVSALSLAINTEKNVCHVEIHSDVGHETYDLDLVTLDLFGSKKTISFDSHSDRGEICEIICRRESVRAESLLKILLHKKVGENQFVPRSFIYEVNDLEIDVDGHVMSVLRYREKVTQYHSIS